MTTVAQRVISSVCLSSLLFLLSIFAAHVYLRSGFPYTHDGENHLARFANYAIAIREGQIPPRFAPNLFTRYGYPVFTFNYPLANMLSVPFSFAKVHYEVSFFILVLISGVIGGWGVWLWVRELQFGPLATLLSIGLFFTSPYLMSALSFRGNIGEVMAICLFPWMFWSLEKLRGQSAPWLLIVVLWAVFLLAHNTFVVISAPILLVYAGLRWGNNWSLWWRATRFGVTAVALTMWFWLPALAEKWFVIVDESDLSKQFFAHFPTLTQLLWSPLQFGYSEAGNVDGLSMSLGVAQGVTVFLAIAALVTSKNNRRWLVGWAVVAISLVLLQLSLSAPFWQVFSLFTRYLQFPWRLTALWIVVFLPLAAYAWERCNQLGKVALFTLLIWQGSAFSRVKAVDYFHHDVIDYQLFSQSTSTRNENRARTFWYEMTDPWQPGPSLLSGKAETQVLEWFGSRRTYVVTVSEPTTLVEPTMYFLGWEVAATTVPEAWVPGQSIGGFTTQKRSVIDSPQIGGRVAYTLDPGRYLISSAMTQWTWDRMVGNGITGVVGIALLFHYLVRLKKIAFERYRQ